MERADKVRVNQRFIDKAQTQALEGTFNVYIGRRFIGTVYAVGSEWQYGGMQYERCVDFDRAIARKVDYYLSTARQDESR